MTTHPIHTVDVFAQGQYTGNQLAVVRDARDLSKGEMQRVAQEMNYSETTFIRDSKPSDDGYRVRIFTPQSELPFAGHPTLGTAYIIREYVAEGTPDTIHLDLDVGSIPVVVETDCDGVDQYWMTQVPPSFEEVLDRSRAAALVDLDDDQLDPEHVCQVVSTGLPTLLIPVKSLDAVQEAIVNSPPYDEFVAEREAKAIIVFTTETVDAGNDLHVRMFAPALGVPEDPATGSGNGALAGYLSRYEYLGTSTVSVTVEQGYEMNRPSLLYLEAERKDELEISIGGRVSPVLEGDLL